MSIQEDWVPTEKELPEDHWSKSPEWRAYKAEIASIKTTPEKLEPFQQVGTISPATRKLTTHDIQMAACKVEWVDPNPPSDIDEGCVITGEFLENLAKKIVDNVNKAVDTSDTSDTESDAPSR